jgi:hypothetical protein
MGEGLKMAKHVMGIDEILDHYIDYMTLYELFRDKKYLQKAKAYEAIYQKAWYTYYVL